MHVCIHNCITMYSSSTFNKVVVDQQVGRQYSQCSDVEQYVDPCFRACTHEVDCTSLACVMSLQLIHILHFTLYDSSSTASHGPGLSFDIGGIVDGLREQTMIAKTIFAKMIAPVDCTSLAYLMSLQQIQILHYSLRLKLYC